MPASLTGPLGSLTWWREVVQAGFRQALQVLLPYLVLVSHGSALTRDDILGGAVAVAVAFVLVVLRRLLGATPGPDASAGADLFYRAVSAFAGSLLGVLSADQLDLLHLHFAAVLTAALSSAAVAVAHGLIDPAAGSLPDAGA